MGSHWKCLLMALRVVYKYDTTPFYFSNRYNNTQKQEPTLILIDKNGVDGYIGYLCVQQEVITLSTLVFVENSKLTPRTTLCSRRPLELSEGRKGHCATQQKERQVVDWFPLVCNIQRVALQYIIDWFPASLKRVKLLHIILVSPASHLRHCSVTYFCERTIIGRLSISPWPGNRLKFNMSEYVCIRS